MLAYILLVEEPSPQACAAVAGPAATAPSDASWPTGMAHAPIPGRSPQTEHPSCRWSSSPSALHPCCSAALSPALGSTGSVRFSSAQQAGLLPTACCLGSWHTWCMPLKQQECQQEFILVAPVSPGCTMSPHQSFARKCAGPRAHMLRWRAAQRRHLRTLRGVAVAAGSALLPQPLLRVRADARIPSMPAAAIIMCNARHAVGW
ncbi:hypothetical protein ABPG77_005904 [Micractinium sp. CCAP 211/92]